MKTKVTLMIQDPTTARVMGMKPTEGFWIDEESYENGPVTKRIAVLDFDVDTGALLDGVTFVAKPKTKRLPYYDFGKLPDKTANVEDFRKFFTSNRHFNQLSVFGVIMRTMKMFENEYVLGRPVTWAFDSPQLLVVPRAGQWANAFYQRETHSLQFFYFPSEKDPDHTIFTSLSRDIVAHETAHAILDGIAPDLYNSITPQALALHEAVADITATLLACQSNKLVLEVLEDKHGAINDSNAFASIAPEFGMGRDPEGEAAYLRQLFNFKTLKDVPADNPHLLSEVLSGALYCVLEKMHEDHRYKYYKDPDYVNREDPMYSCSGKALAAAGFRLRNVIFRALDYLPPGEISFADYGRAILAVDTSADLNKPEVRDWFKMEFLKRRIIFHKDELEVKTNFEHPALHNIDINKLVENKNEAWKFAEKNRELLHIPPTVKFDVLLPILTEKIYFDLEREKIKAKECIFKVSWEDTETNLSAYPVPEKRAIRRGTTLAVDVEKRLVKFILTSDRSDKQVEDRNRMLNRLLDDRVLRLDQQALGNDGKILGSVIQAKTSAGLLRIQGSARMLHIAG